MSSGFLEKCLIAIYKYLPLVTAGFSFLPCGLVFGYTVISFVLESKVKLGVVAYGPMIVGTCVGFIVAVMMYLMKAIRKHFVFWHFEMLLVASGFHLTASAFFFASSLDIVGSFLAFFAHSVTFVCVLSYLHVICSKRGRSIFLSSCFAWYMLGLATSVTLIGNSFRKHNPNVVSVDSMKETEGIYVSFAGTYLSIAVVLGVLLSAVKVLSFFGNVDYKESHDDEFRIANSNETIFEKRSEIIKRVVFFYVTGNRQWFVSAYLLLLDAIDYAMFIYFIFWFSLNKAVAVSDDDHRPALFWVLFGGSAFNTICMTFISIKTNYILCKLCQILLTFLSMLIFTNEGSKIPFLMILFFFGMSFGNIKVTVVETAHFKYSELLLFVSYFTQMLSTSIIYFYFVSNGKNMYFYSEDYSTLIAQGLVFIIITVLVAIVFNLEVPKTFNTTLFDIRYGLLGVIFKKHQIEQLNVHWLKDGTIPTISEHENHYKMNDRAGSSYI
ncbi:hypothetical protein ACFFRR_002702 [Megaselia abdita]